MIRKFDELSRLSSALAKAYAADMFRLLMAYKDISATEASSRLGLHIQTVQEFLETLNEAGILERNEVNEGKRPYFRYTLNSENLQINVSLKDLVVDRTNEATLRIKEYKNSGARFNLARGQEFFGSISWFDEGRRGKINRIKLTEHQGRFLYHLPFPDADSMSVQEILKSAGLEKEHFEEIMDLVSFLIEKQIIEKA